MNMRICAGLFSAVLLAAPAESPKFWLDFPGKAGPGSGKHIVLVSGDEEYRSEEALPQLARILSERHGFHTTVLFAIDPASGTINPETKDNIPGLEMLDRADLLILFTRFRDLPDEQMKHIVDYVKSGKPVIGIRTATHAFEFKTHKTYASWSWNNKDTDGGFGREVLGETWIDHHGRHKVQSTRGMVAEGQEGHPVLRGISSGDIWAPTDVYKVRLPLPADCTPLVLGQVLTGMKATDPPAADKNDPMMPVAWVKTYRPEHGGASRVFTTTMGSSQDLLNEGFRRLLVNATYWTLGLEQRMHVPADAGLVGKYDPLPFGFGGFRKGVRVDDLR